MLEPTSNKLMVGRSSWIRRILKDGNGDPQYPTYALAGSLVEGTEVATILKFSEFQGYCQANFPLLLKSFFKSLTTMAYSSSSLSEYEASSSLDTFLTLRANDLYFPFYSWRPLSPSQALLHRPSS
ncbi:hypothetical protein Tco_0874146 [Tanacetum coccineum]|uniref:Uncharacterized protein n=1 Tax=Tanacetum coccineum TaxID=301880 RepID=A0ABQ5BKV4_9ASTR